MTTRLNTFSWGWFTIALAYFVAVLPIEAPHHMFLLGILVAMVYLVLARHTSHVTVELVQSSSDKSIFALWRTAFRATLMHRALLMLPMFSLMLSAHQFLSVISPQCSTLLQAFCSLNNSKIQIELAIIAASLLGILLLFDHALLVALSLLAHKYLSRSTAFIGNTAVGLRFTIACVVLSFVAVFLSFFEVAGHTYGYSNTQTDGRILETVYPAFEPIVTTGVLLTANILTHPSYCSYTPQPCHFYDSRPYVARQMVSAFMSMLMYVLLIVGVLRLSRTNTYKAKRGDTKDVYR